MTFETALRSRLKNDATINTIIGKKGGVSSIDWKERPERAPFPSIVLEVVFGDRSQHMGGFNAFQPYRTQFRCTADNPADAVALRDAVIECIAPEETVEDVKFLRAQGINHFGRVERGGAATLHHEFVEAEIWSGPAS